MLNNQITELNYTNFESFLAGKTVLVDFWAEWCQPCKPQRRQLEELSLEYGDLFRCATVNVDDNKLIAGKQGVRNLPTLALYVDGSEVRRFIGLQNKEQLINQIKRSLSNQIEING